MSVRLHIERLVVDPGLGAAGTDGPVLREAIVAELARLLGEDAGQWRSSDAWQVRGPDARPAQTGAEALGAEVACAIHRSVRL